MTWTPSKIAGMLTDKAKLGSLCQHLFKDIKGQPFHPYTYQLDIIHAIMSKQIRADNKTYKKVLCWATTRAGKSEAVAIGGILQACYGEGELIRIIGSTKPKTQILMEYFRRHLLDNEMLYERLLLDTDMGVERIKKELSKQRLTFQDNTEVMTISADIKQKGENLFGYGGSIFLIDETELIPTDIIRAGLIRMLGDTPDAFLFMIGNPIRMGYMYDSRRNSDFYQIKIGWEQCVKEGRLPYDFVMQQKRDLTPTEFTILYESEYPEEGEDTLNKWKWIQNSRDKYDELIKQEAESPEVSLDDRAFVLGVDVARYGSNWTIHATREITSKYQIIRDLKKSSKKDTMITAGETINLDRKYKYQYINIDEGGLGGGVVDRLKEQAIGSKVVGVQAGESPKTESGKKRFKNIKAEMHVNVSKMLEDGILLIPDDKKLIDQLFKLRVGYESSGKMFIIDADGPSPDEADGVALACLKTLQVAFSPIGRSGDDQTALVKDTSKRGSIMKF